MIKPPVPRPVFGSCEGLAVGVGSESTEALAGDAAGPTGGAAAAESTQAWCWTPLSSVTMLSTPEAHSGVSQEISVLTLASLPLNSGLVSARSSTPSPSTHATDDVLGVGDASAIPADPATLTVTIPAAAMS